MAICHICLNGKKSWECSFRINIDQLIDSTFRKNTRENIVCRISWTRSFLSGLRFFRHHVFNGFPSDWPSLIVFHWSKSIIYNFVVCLLVCYFQNLHTQTLQNAFAPDEVLFCNSQILQKRYLFIYMRSYIVKRFASKFTYIVNFPSIYVIFLALELTHLSTFEGTMKT